MESIAIGLTATGKGSIAGRTLRVATLLLLFGPLAPAGALPSAIVVRNNPVFQPGNVRVPERLVGLPGLTNVGRIAPGILRGAQPKPEGYATLKAMGIKTVINLRTRHGERKAVEAAGMRYIEIPMSFWRKVNPAVVRMALLAMTDSANHPVFLHCSRGKDRAGVVAAVYRMEVEGWSEAEAEAEMEAFGFHGIWFQLKKFVHRYPEEQLGKVSIPKGGSESSRLFTQD